MSSPSLPADGITHGLVAVPRREAHSAQVARHLIDYLLSGNLAAGDRLPSERQLAAALQVGRAAVREAIKSLSLLGLVEVRLGDGTYLSSSTSQLLPQVIQWGLLLGGHRIRDLMEVRNHLEIAAVGLAAERGDAASAQRLHGAIEDMRTAGHDLGGFVQADIAFHLAVAEASRNEVFVNLLDSIQALLREWARRALERDHEIDIALAMHIPVAEAVENRDIEGARAAMAAHNARWQRRVQGALELELEPAGPATASVSAVV